MTGKMNPGWQSKYYYDKTFQTAVATIAGYTTLKFLVDPLKLYP